MGLRRDIDDLRPLGPGVSSVAWVMNFSSFWLNRRLPVVISSLLWRDRGLECRDIRGFSGKSWFKLLPELSERFTRSTNKCVLFKNFWMLDLFTPNSLTQIKTLPGAGPDCL
jgi:hypothetical protein